MRLKDSLNEVLKNDTRKAIYTSIQSNPGISFADIKKEHNLSNGSISHHTHILLKKNFIYKIEINGRIKYFPKEYQGNKLSFLTEKQKKILRHIKKEEHTTPTFISKKLNMSFAKMLLTSKSEPRFKWKNSESFKYSTSSAILTRKSFLLARNDP